MKKLPVIIALLFSNTLFAQPAGDFCSGLTRLFKSADSRLADLPVDFILPGVGSGEKDDGNFYFSGWRHNENFASKEDALKKYEEWENMLRHCSPAEYQLNVQEDNEERLHTIDRIKNSKWDPAVLDFSIRDMEIQLDIRYENSAYKLGFWVVDKDFLRAWQPKDKAEAKPVQPITQQPQQSLTPCEALNRIIGAGPEFTGVQGYADYTMPTGKVYHSNIIYPGSDSTTFHVPSFGFKVWIADLITTTDEYKASRKYDETFAAIKDCIFDIGIVSAHESDTYIGKTTVIAGDIFHPEFEKSHKRFQMQLVKMKVFENYVVLLRISYNYDNPDD